MKKIYALYYQVSQLVLQPDFLKFIFSGLLSVAIEFFLLIILVEKFKLSVFISNSIAFIITNIFNYLLSRLWVFGKSHRRIRHEVFLFFSTTAVGLLINQAIMWCLVDAYHLNYKVAKLFAIVLVVIWNFWSKKFLVFSTPQKKQHV
ncbi:GtrA family protein [Parasediminibacterium sp. JCM 36343]|uniref:GtrA family protein n=1 Tax=Parasediminibacterium sp. JCM 36343 TaxID=3374279 RepID=UPI003977FB75